MENRHLSNCRKEIMEQELIRGRDTANQLLEVIENKLNINLHHHGDLEGLIIPLAQDLVNKICQSAQNLKKQIMKLARVLKFKEAATKESQMQLLGRRIAQF
ncbi:uncharacterized protein LOC123894900 isoform X3 [Trifolium pratense]|uniref:uncharacterized protein LOC123894900 isoform X3 n=1 Tax=Trifolium pratense TaxID=57577 RepID=UPI001E6927B9|nr:uncharacterized protein LOC123894900 isoform X3 [Trifolium pratense]